jgi:putative oxidoreductase
MVVMGGGLLLLRLVVGLLLAGHGGQKLFGWFDGPGLDGTSRMFGSLGWRPGRFFAVLGGVIEFVGGLLLAAGLFTPVVAGVIAAQMFVAILAVHWDKGIWNTNDGAEYPLVIAATALALAATGAGKYSLDAVTGWWQPSAATGFVAALGLAIVGTLAGELSRRMTPHGRPVRTRVA